MALMYKLFNICVSNSALVSVLAMVDHGRLALSLEKKTRELTGSNTMYSYGLLPAANAYFSHLIKSAKMYTVQ